MGVTVEEIDRDDQAMVLVLTVAEEWLGRHPSATTVTADALALAVYQDVNPDGIKLIASVFRGRCLDHGSTDPFECHGVMIEALGRALELVRERYRKTNGGRPC